MAIEHAWKLFDAILKEHHTTLDAGADVTLDEVGALQELRVLELHHLVTYVDGLILRGDVELKGGRKLVTAVATEIVSWEASFRQLRRAAPDSDAS